MRCRRRTSRVTDADCSNSLGNFDDRYNCYEHYAKIYPTLSGSMMPFTLRVVKATLPFLTKKDKSLDQLFELIEWVKQRYLRARVANASTDGDAELEQRAMAELPLNDGAPVTLAALNNIDAAVRAAAQAGQPLTDAATPPLRWRVRLRRLRFLGATLLASEQRLPLAASLLECERRHRYAFVATQGDLQRPPDVESSNEMDSDDADMPLLVRSRGTERGCFF